jgi:hypothetical protein
MTNKETGYYIAAIGVLYWWYTYEPSVQIDPADAIVNKTDAELLDTEGIEYIEEKETNNLLTTPAPIPPSTPDPDINIIDYPTEPEDFGLIITG